MNYLNATKLDSGKHPAWKPQQPSEDVLAFYDSPSSAVEALQGNANARRSYFASKAHREEVTLKPDTWLDMDFCNGYLDFNTFSLKLPGGLHFSLLKYWDGQVGSDSFTTIYHLIVLAAGHLCLQEPRRLEGILLHRICKPLSI